MCPLFHGKIISDSPPAKRLPLALFFAITSLGILSILFVEFIPEMVVQGKFSPLARALNILGGIGFIIAASFFMVRYRFSSARSDYLFAIHCSLFGAAGVLFELSQLWDAAWWWYLLRLMAYSAGLVLAISSYRDTEMKLQQSEIIVSNSTDMIALLDIDYTYLAANSAYLKTMKKTYDQIIGKKAVSVFGEEFFNKVIKPNADSCLGGEEVNYQAWFDFPTPSKVYMDISYYPHFGIDKEIKGFVVRGKDITEHKRAEEKIKTLSRFPDENPQPVLRVSEQGELLYANKSSLQLLQTWNIDMGQTVPASWHSFITEVISSQSNKAVEIIVKDRHYLMMLAYIEGFNYVNIYGAAITESKHSDKLLKFYTEELERSNKDLEEFAYLASHDLQEPLRKITTFGDLLIDTSLSMDKKGKDYVLRMQKAAKRMRNFIEALLEYSKISKTQKQNEMVDLNLIVANILEDFEGQISKYNGTIHVESLPTLEGDLSQFQILFQNLISNSLKYQREGIAPVLNLTSSYSSEMGKWTIEVADNGIGMEEKYFKKIFKPFERLHSQSTFEGTGIGLAICKKIVQRHHGSIMVTSELQKGTTFKVSLPKKQPTLPT